MQTQKMSLANIKGKLSRAEMKNIMAGSGEGTGTWLCWIKPKDVNGNAMETYGKLFQGNTCQDASTEANIHCVTLIATPGNGVYHCGYNCGC